MKSDIKRYSIYLNAKARYVTYYLRHVAWRFMDDGCQNSAAALTYMTLFAVVPMMTVMYSMFSMIPSFQSVGDQVRELVFSNFVPAASSDVQSYLVEFSDQARRLGVVGAGVLFVTSYLMLSNIEKSFNRIWAAPSKRLGLSSFLLYWAVLSLGPLLLGAGLVMNTYLLSLNLVKGEFAQIGEGIHILFSVLPWFLTAIAFTLLYKAVPNCQVPFRNALLGGVVAMLFFQLAKSGFSELVSQTSYTTIYGAFAILPLFLFWIYLCWMIILAGAEFVRALETFSFQYRGRKQSELLASLVALWRLWNAQKQGDQLSDFDIVQAGVSPTQWRALRDRFLSQKIIASTETGRFVLARDLDDINVWDLVAKGQENFVSWPSDADPLISRYQWTSNIGVQMSELENVAREKLATPLSELFREREESEFLNEMRKI